MAKENFMSSAEWETSEKFDGRDISKWEKVPEKTIFQVVFLETKENTTFNSYILHYADKADKVYKCWAPKHFVSQIQATRATYQRPYFVSHGLVKSGAKNIANFEISYQNLDKEFEIFIDDASSSEIQS